MKDTTEVNYRQQVIMRAARQKHLFWKSTNIREFPLWNLLWEFTMNNIFDFAENNA